MEAGGWVTIFVSVVVVGGSFPTAGEHVETLQAALQAADQAWTQQGPAGRGKADLFPLSSTDCHLSILQAALSDIDNMSDPENNMVAWRESVLHVYQIKITNQMNRDQI